MCFSRCVNRVYSRTSMWVVRSKSIISIHWLVASVFCGFVMCDEKILHPQIRLILQILTHKSDVLVEARQGQFTRRRKGICPIQELQECKKNDTFQVAVCLQVSFSSFSLGQPLPPCCRLYSMMWYGTLCCTPHNITSLSNHTARDDFNDNDDAFSCCGTRTPEFYDVVGWRKRASHAGPKSCEQLFCKIRSLLPLFPLSLHKCIMCG